MGHVHLLEHLKSMPMPGLHPQGSDVIPLGTALELSRSLSWAAMGLKSPNLEQRVVSFKLFFLMPMIEKDLLEVPIQVSNMDPTESILWN